MMLLGVGLDPQKLLPFIHQLVLILVLLQYCVLGLKKMRQQDGLLLSDVQVPFVRFI
jgi:hypothetical protein